jgi:voltage-gated potassium channel
MACRARGGRWWRRSSNAAAITLFERHEADINIKNFGDGIWWAATTVTTVGYGDRFPVTAEGRAIATFLMALGISLFSFITANVAAFLSKQGSSDEPTLSELKEHIQRLED